MCAISGALSFLFVLFRPEIRLVTSLRDAAGDPGILQTDSGRVQYPVACEVRI